MYILGTYSYENPVLVHTKYILFLSCRTDMYQYILGMYWYEHLRRVSSRVSGFQMELLRMDICVLSHKPELLRNYLGIT